MEFGAERGEKISFLDKKNGYTDRDIVSQANQFLRRVFVGRSVTFVGSTYRSFLCFALVLIDFFCFT